MNIESFDFLGFTFQKFYNIKLNRKRPYMMPSRKALKKVKDSIREVTCRKSAYESLEHKVEKLNPIIRGWRNYFANRSSYLRFKQLDEYLWMKLWRQKYCYRKQRNHRDRILVEFNEWFRNSGIEFFYAQNKKKYLHSL